jgi:Ca2+-transporting ATPase
MPPPHSQPVAELLASLHSDAGAGLSSAEAHARLERYGRNELPTIPPPPAWRRFLNQFSDPLTILILVATVVSFVAWLIESAEPVPFEALTILAIVLLNGVLGFVQEQRAEQAVAALAALTTPEAQVIRDGQSRTIPAAELVPGDLLLLEEGDTIPADGRVVEAIALRVAEATLTGESTPVSKSSAPVAADATLGDQRSMVFSGTTVTTGRGRILVTGTGAATVLGGIADTLQTTPDDPTPLQHELAGVGRALGIGVIVIALMMSGAILLLSDIRTLRDFVDVLLLGVSLAVAAVPEGLTAITTIVLALGMQRMARRNVIVRRLAAVETLGSTTVICTDKTGTLTKNEMTVRSVITASGRVDFSGVGYTPEGALIHDNAPLDEPDLRTEVERALRAADLANNAVLVQDAEGRWQIQGDPTEGALRVAARKAGLSAAQLAERFPRVGEVPFTSERKLMSTAHADAKRSNRLVLFAKGAPDVLLANCTHQRVGAAVRPLTDADRRTILANVDILANEALRTLGVAYRSLDPDDLDGELGPEHEADLVFLGVLGLIDPPRDEAHTAVAAAQAAGIRPIMITGDHPATAATIATELGICPVGARTVTGAELQHTSDEQLQAMVRDVSVYARVAPEHKLRIVQALRANHAITAMTGDGVNDAPALKAADIGVAMGITGTDVSKGAADMILADDNFASIVAAVEEGRAIFANIQKFLRYLLASNIGEVFTMFSGVILAGLLGLQANTDAAIVVPLLAVQILWINLLTDAGPALALGIEPADPHVMTQPPRDPRSRVITRRMWVDMIFVGIIMAIGTLAVMDASLPGGLIVGSGTLAYAQTMAFTTLVFFQLFHVLNARSETRSAFSGLFRNPWLWLAIAVSVLLQILVVYIPLLQQAFRTVPLALNDWVLCCAVASSVLWLMELRKLARAWRA